MIKEQFYQNKAGWKKSFLEGFSQDENGHAVPWMSYPAIDFLRKFLRPEMQIFEFGCGASTLFFSNKVRKVIGLETNPTWLKIIQEKIALNCESSKNVEIFLMPDGLENPQYQSFAADYCKNNNSKFDILIIDSLKRFECAKAAISAISEDGIIILDDSERKNYAKIFRFFEEAGFITTNFFGIAPGQLRVKNTTIFSRKNLHI